MCVILVNKLRVISYHTQNPLALPKLLLSLYFLIYVVLLVSLGRNKYYMSFIDDFSKFT
jgi:hypothetical protein